MGDTTNDILVDVALQLGATRDVEPLLRVAVSRVADLVGAERALCALFDESGAVERCVAHNLEWSGPGHPLPVSQSVIQRALHERVPVLVTDASVDKQLKSHSSVRRFGLRLIGCVPVVGRERVLGVLYVDSAVNVLPDLHQRSDLLTALSRVLAAAIENAQLFEEQRWRAAVLSQIVHDFRTPLAVIIANAQLMLDEEPPSLDDLHSMATDVRASAERMLSMVSGVLEMSRSGANGEAPEPVSVDVAAAASRHVSKLTALARHRALTLRVESVGEVPRARTLADWLPVLLDNLVFNAIKHAKRGSEVVVRVSCRADAGPPEAHARGGARGPHFFRAGVPLRPREDARYVEVAVHNEGAPIPPALLKDLFQSFVRGSAEAGGYASTGLGLAIVDQCVRHLGGLVWAESSGQSTCFRFTLPTALSSDAPA